jgi:hypothetical protein
VVGSHDILILESMRHDMAQPLGADTQRPMLGAYRARAAQLAKLLAQFVADEAVVRGPGRPPVQVFWRTAANPPGVQGKCNHPSNRPPIVLIANLAGAGAFSAHGLGVLAQHQWAAGFHSPRWWPHGEAFADVHTHEGWCPPPPSYKHAGVVHGWVSKALTQLTMRAACAQAHGYARPPRARSAPVGALLPNQRRSVWVSD